MALAAGALCTLLSPVASASTCYGDVGNGRLAQGVQLPAKGQNYLPYSTLGIQAGRTYLHRAVRDVVVDAYAILQKTAPEKIYVYGETGLQEGGRIRPHRTHQTGTSVDFMVPVIDKAGRSVPLPGTAFNKFGYDLEFDSRGRYKQLTIDFAAMGEHLYQLAIAAENDGIKIKKVILDPDLAELMFKTERGPFLRKLPFMKARPWIRHDEHYHVDFAVTCQPLASWPAK